MNDIEIQDVLDIARDFWPKAVGSELGLLRKILKNHTLQTAKTILEDAKMGHPYSTLPISDIGKLLKKHRVQKVGDDYHCWALGEGAKYYECVVTATNPDGAKVQMCKYLDQVCRKEPTDYILFIGRESYPSFFASQIEIIRSMDPDFDSKVERFKKIQQGKRVDKMVSVLPEMPEIPEFDPDNDDGVPF